MHKKWCPNYNLNFNLHTLKEEGRKEKKRSFLSASIFVQSHFWTPNKQESHTYHLFNMQSISFRISWFYLFTSSITYYPLVSIFFFSCSVCCMWLNFQSCNNIKNNKTVLEYWKFMVFKFLQTSKYSLVEGT